MVRKEEEYKSFSAFFKSQKYFLKLIFRERPKSIIIYGFLILLVSVIPPILIIINKLTIDNISKLNQNDQLLTLIISLLILYSALQFFTEFINSLKLYLINNISLVTNYILKTLLSEKLFNLSLEKFEDNKFFDSLNLANMALNNSGVKVVGDTISIIGSLISLVGIFGVLLSIHWALPISLVLTMLPGIILIFLGKFKSFKMYRFTSQKERELYNTEELFTSKVSLKEIKIFDTGSYLIRKWQSIYKEVQVQKNELGLWELKNKSFASLFLHISNVGVSLFLVYHIMGDELSIGSYVALTTAVTTLQGILASIGLNLGNIFEVAIYNSALLKILNLKNNEYGQENNQEINEIESITFKNATFLYPGSDIEVLKNVTFEIRKGQTIAILGSNGSGKTTLVNCILGLYDLTSGSYEINGIPIEKLDRRKLLSNFSVLFQDFVKYKFSIRENLALGNLNELKNDNLLYNSLNDVGLEKILENSSVSLDTFLSKEFEGGRDLSGGEWQRLALARMILKKSNVLILDEPTSALDPLAELEILNKYFDLSIEKTTITISHRVGPTISADCIIVMEQGEIVEMGSFEDLMNVKGTYYSMYTSQASWYKSENEVYA